MAIKFFEEGGNHITKCKVIALANQKGGTARTTTTLNLGIGLAHQGRKVLLVNADTQGDLTTALGWTNTDQSFDYIRNTNEEDITRRTVCV